MIVTPLIAAIALFAPQGPSLVCPTTGEAVAKAASSIDYAGVRYGTCCAGCDGPFKKDPAKALKSPALKGKTAGVSLFDPVTGLRLDAKAARGGSSDFGGVRYLFASAENKKAFDAEPKKYGTSPAKEALFCPVMKHEVASYAASGGYVDHEGVRYYVCCGGCMDGLKADPAKFVANASAAVKAPVAKNAPK